MKKNFKSELSSPILLLIISILMGFLIYYSKKQVDLNEKTGDSFSKFQIETLKNNAKITETLKEIKTWTHTIYNNEVHPNTIRSQKNEKDITLIRYKVIKVKSKTR